MFDTLSTAAPLINDGKIRGIAATSVKRSQGMPKLPTVAEAGVKDYSADAWSGLVAPAGTPREVIAKLQGAVARIAASEQMQKRLEQVGSEAVDMPSSSRPASTARCPLGRDRQGVGGQRRLGPVRAGRSAAQAQV